jgi:hypothetical protein
MPKSPSARWRRRFLVLIFLDCDYAVTAGGAREDFEEHTGAARKIGDAQVTRPKITGSGRSEIAITPVTAGAWPMWQAVHAAADSGVLWMCQTPPAAIVTSSVRAARYKNNRGNCGLFFRRVAVSCENRLIFFGGYRRDTMKSILQPFSASLQVQK